MQIKQEAKKINNLMKFQKITITKNVNKCLTLLDQFKQEQNYGNSPLVEQAAREVETLQEAQRPAGGTGYKHADIYKLVCTNH